MGPFTNNRFRPAPSPNDPAIAPFVDDSCSDSIPVKILHTVHEEETNGHTETSSTHDVGNNSKRTQTKSNNFSFKQVRRNLSKQLSLDDFDWDAAKQRNEQIEQIALNDHDLYTVPESKLEQAWLGFLSTLSDTFLVARLAIRLMSYLGVGKYWQLKHAVTVVWHLFCLILKHLMCRRYMGFQGYAFVLVHTALDAWICTGKHLQHSLPSLPCTSSMSYLAVWQCRCSSSTSCPLV